MPIRTKFILSFLVLTLPTLIIGISSIYLINKLSAPLHTDIPAQITKLAKSSDLGEKALYIRYYDEVLTQSARNYAFTGDVKWKDRYNQEVPKLDTIIKEALAEGDEKDKDTFAGIDQANLALIDMETRSIELVDEKDLLQAQIILDSPEYAKQKTLYQNGLVLYAQRRGLELDNALVTSSETLEKISKQTADLTVTGITQIGIVLGVSLIFSLLLALILSRVLIKTLEEIKNKAQNMAKGNFDDTLNIDSKDEIGQLAQAINTMSHELKHSKLEIEEKVTQRTLELEKLNKFMVGRELKMAELKGLMNQQKAGGPKP